MLPGLSKEEFGVLMVSVGTHARKRHISPLDVTRLLKKSVSAPAGSRQRCAKALGVGATTISTFLSLEKITPDIQHLIGWRKGEGMSIPFSVMALVSKLDHAEQQRKVAEAILESGLVWKEVVSLIQIFERSEQSIDDCIKATLKRRPDIKKKYMFIGAIFKELRPCVEQISQEERDKILLRIVSKFIKDSDEINCRLGVERFSIMASKRVGDLLHKTPKEIENFINDSLRGIALK